MIISLQERHGCNEVTFMYAPTSVTALSGSNLGSACVMSWTKAVNVDESQGSLEA